jgi:IS30 family transposase
MNAPIVSAEAKARLTEAVKNYTPPAPEKYRALNEVKESIIALRERKASYETIRAMLHENAGIEVSHQTVARYCREVLDAARRRSRAVQRRHRANHRHRPRGIGSTSAVRLSPRPRGPRIADSKNL